MSTDSLSTISNRSEDEEIQEPLEQSRELRGKASIGSLRVMYTSFFLEQFAYAMTLPSIALFAMNKPNGLKLTATKYGICLGGFYIAHLFSSLAAGRFSDSIGRRPILLYSFFFTGLGCFLLTIISGISSISNSSLGFALFLVFRIVAGLGGDSSSTSQAFVIDSTDYYERSSYLGILTAGVGLSNVAGPLVTTTLAKVMSNNSRFMVFLLGAVSAWGSTGYAYFKLGESLPLPRRKPLNCSFFSSSDWKNTNIGLWYVIMTRFWKSMSYHLFFVSYAYFLKDNFSISKDEHFALILAWAGLVQALTQFLLYPQIIKKIGKHRTLGFFTFLLFACYGFLLFLSLNDWNKEDLFLPVHIPWLTVFQFVSATCDPALPDTMTTFVTDKKRLGFSAGLVAAFRSSGSVIGAMLGGLAYEYKSGKHIVFILPVVTSFITAIFGLLQKELGEVSEVSDVDKVVVIEPPKVEQDGNPSEDGDDVHHVEHDEERELESGLPEETEPLQSA